MIDFHNTNDFLCRQAPSWDIWGYVRASSSPQVISPEVQTEEICKIIWLVAPWLHDPRAWEEWKQSHIFADPATSGTYVPYFKRRGFVKLLEHIGEEDRLVIWRQERIDRVHSRFVEILDWLGDTKKIWLCVTAEGGGFVDMSYRDSRFAPKIQSLCEEHANHRKAIAAQLAIAHMRRQGCYFHGRPMPGYRRYLSRRGRRTVGNVYRHDERERTLIREMAIRHCTLGEPALSIHADFKRRGEMTADSDFRRPTPWSYDRIARVLKWWRGCLKRGLEPWIDCNPYGFEPLGPHQTGNE